MDTTGAVIPGTHYAEDHQIEPVLKIWKSEYVDQYRWVLTFGASEYEVFHGNATSLEQAMRDIDHCRRIYESRDSLATVY